MPIVQTPTILLKPHSHLIRECKAYAAKNWQMHYDQTILNTADYLQLLQDDKHRSLLESALTRARESLEKLLNQVPEATPHEHYGCFSAALHVGSWTTANGFSGLHGNRSPKPRGGTPWFRRRSERSAAHYDWKWIETPNASRPPSVRSSL